MRKIGVLSLESEHFLDEANQTIGAPGVTEEAIMNRRLVTSKVNPTGAYIKEKVFEYFRDNYGLDIKLEWSRNAGCAMCPCSPGFNILANVNIPQQFSYYKYFRQENQFNVYTKGQDLDVREPERNILHKIENKVENEVGTQI